jgi:hypothetical protein
VLQLWSQRDNLETVSIVLAVNWQQRRRQLTNSKETALWANLIDTELETRRIKVTCSCNPNILREIVGKVMLGWSSLQLSWLIVPVICSPEAEWNAVHRRHRELAN